MTWYRKKPVVVEAFQMTGERRWNNCDWPHWLHEAWQLDDCEYGCLYCKDGGDALFISTLEGEMEVSFGDWIIQGIKGELYPCRDDIFKASYEEVD